MKRGACNAVFVAVLTIALTLLASGPLLKDAPAQAQLAPPTTAINQLCSSVNSPTTGECPQVLGALDQSAVGKLPTAGRDVSVPIVVGLGAVALGFALVALPTIRKFRKN